MRHQRVTALAAAPNPLFFGARMANARLSFAFISPEGRVASSCRTLGLVLILATSFFTELISLKAVVAQDTPPAVLPTADGDFPAEQLTVVSDFTGLSRIEERDVYYGLLEVARLVPLKVQKQRAHAVAEAAEKQFRENPRRKGQPYSVFSDLVLSPQSYRGKPVTMEGYIQKLDRMEAGENPFGLKELYQVYLFTEESKGNPLVVVCREIPSHLPLPTKGNATNHIHVTGYFYKLWPYEAGRGNWAAPLLMANRLEYRPPQPSAASLWMRQGFLLGVPSLFAVCLTAFWLRSRANEQRRRQLADQSRQDLTLPDLIPNFDDGSKIPANGPSEA